MKLGKLHFLTLAALIATSSGPLGAQTLPFPEAWAKIQGSSESIKASDAAVESAQSARSRAKRHWWPRVFMDARGYETNDPGASFFGLLQQRELTNADFSADRINHPAKSTYLRGSLGVDLPLYEGGSATAKAAMSGHAADAEVQGASQMRLEQYAMAAQLYAGIALLERQSAKLSRLNADVEKMIKSYRLGSKSNPVGYSALLGMRSLGNRIQGYLQRYQAQSKAQYSALSEMGLNSEKWKAEPIESDAFVAKYLDPANFAGDGESFRVQAARASTAAAQNAVKLERSRFLPRLGAFAEAYTFNGDRGTADGYSAGLYLRWDIFDPQSFGAVSEARLKSAQAAHSLEAFRRQERAERTAQLEGLKALRSGLTLLKESDRLLNEQIEIAGTLFRNGSISALQVVEVLNRRTDLIEQQVTAEQELLKAAAEGVRRQPFEIQNATTNAATERGLK